MLKFIEDNSVPLGVNLDLNNLIANNGAITWNPPLSDITFAGFMNDCSNNQSLFDMLELNNAEQLDIKSQINIDNFVNQIKTDISNNLVSDINDAITATMNTWKDDMVAYTSEIETKFNALNLDDIDTAINDGISGSGTALATLISDLEAFDATASATSNTARNQAVTDLKSIQANSYATLESRFQTFSTNAEGVVTEGNQMIADVQAIEGQIDAANTELTTNLPGDIETKMNQFVDDIGRGFVAKTFES